MGEYFNLQAKQWDSPERIRRADLIIQKMYSFLPQKRWQRALEVGCGTGLIGERMQKVVEELIMIDTSEAMVEVASKKIKEKGETGVKIIYHDLMNNDLDEESFDLIFLSMALHHVKDVSHAAERFYYHLKPGGTLCVIDLNPDDGTFHGDDPCFDGYNGFEQGILQKIFIQQGYVNVRSETFLNDVKVVKGHEHPFSLFIMTAQKPIVL